MVEGHERCGGASLPHGRRHSSSCDPSTPQLGAAGRLAYMKVCGRDIKIQGRLVRIACPELDSYESLGDPDAVLNGLRKSAVRVDLFTFMQSIAEASPKYAYPMEWDNLAVLPVSTFDHWWNHQIR